MEQPTIEDLLNFVKSELTAQPVLHRLEEIIQSKTSTAGAASPEEVFTREFLCPVLSRFFYEHVRGTLGFEDSQIACGLGIEGFRGRSAKTLEALGFGFAPARQGKHFYTKDEFVKSTVPKDWGSAQRAAPKQACPDFAIQRPLPFSMIGEVKYFRGRTCERAIKELYDASRQAVFYLGAFGGQYQNACIVIADASEEHFFEQSLQHINFGIRERFGKETGVYLCVIPLH